MENLWKVNGVYMEPHRVTITFETDDSLTFVNLTNFALALTGLVRPAVSVEYEACRSEELDAFDHDWSKEESSPF